MMVLLNTLVLSIQHINHIGITQGGYKMYGKLLGHLLKIIDFNLLNKVHKVELIVGSVIEELAPRAQTRVFIVLKTPLCDTYIHT